MVTRTASAGIGIYLYAAAAIATGLVNLVWGAFEPAEEPIQSFGDRIPGQSTFAYIIALCLIAAGALVLWRRTARAGAGVLAIVYLIFAVFWLPRLVTAPAVLGFRFPVFVGVLAGVCQQLILVGAAAILYAKLAASDSSWPRRAGATARWVFGLSSIIFGLAHLGARHQDVADLVPKWMPFGGNFWALFTGVCFLLAGVAVLSGILDVLAAWLLGLMLLVFSVLALAPMLVASASDHTAWGVNAYNLSAVAAVWILAAYLAERRAPRVGRMAADPIAIV